MLGNLNIKKKFNNYLFKNLSIVFLESIITKGLSFLSILILSRYLGPHEYGMYSYFFVAIAFLSAFFDFGMENTAVRFSSREKDKLNTIFGLYFIVKLSILIVVVSGLILMGEEIFLLLDKGELIKYLPFLIVGLIGESLFFINDTYLQAKQKFKIRAFINIFRYSILFLISFLLILNKILELKYVFFLYFIPLFISIPFLYKYVVFLKHFYTEKLSRIIFKEIKNYEKWMLLISIPNNILGRIDFFLISLWVSYDQIGIYNAAFQLSAIVSFIPFAFGKVMLPAMAELEPFAVINKTKKILKPIVLISILFLSVLPIVSFIVPLVLGEDYMESVPVLQIMLVSAIFSFAIVPIEQAIYSLGLPKFITLGKHVQIAFIIIFSFFTVPYFGMIWAAVSVTLARLIYSFILSLLFFRYIRSLKHVDTIPLN